MVLGITSLSLVRGNRFVEMMMVLMAGRDAPKNPLFPPISEFVLDRIFEFVLDTPCYLGGALGATFTPQQ